MEEEQSESEDWLYEREEESDMEEQNDMQEGDGREDSEGEEDLDAHPLPDRGEVLPAGQKVWLRGPARLPDTPYQYRGIVLEVEGDK